MDDSSGPVRRVLNSVVASQPRNYVVMEIKSNLLAEGRAETLKRFNTPHYSRVAQITMGKPTGDFKAKVHDQLRRLKQQQVENEWRARQEERAKAKQAKMRQRSEAASDEGKQNSGAETEG